MNPDAFIAKCKDSKPLVAYGDISSGDSSDHKTTHNMPSLDLDSYSSVSSDSKHVKEKKAKDKKNRKHKKKKKKHKDDYILSTRKSKHSLNDSEIQYDKSSFSSPILTEYKKHGISYSPDDSIMKEQYIHKGTPSPYFPKKFIRDNRHIKHGDNNHKVLGQYDTDNLQTEKAKDAQRSKKYSQEEFYFDKEDNCNYKQHHIPKQHKRSPRHYSSTNTPSYEEIEKKEYSTPYKVSRNKEKYSSRSSRSISTSRHNDPISKSPLDSYSQYLDSHEPYDRDEIRSTGQSSSRSMDQHKNSTKYNYNENDTNLNFENKRKRKQHNKNYSNEHFKIEYPKYVHGKEECYSALYDSNMKKEKRSRKDHKHNQNSSSDDDMHTLKKSKYSKRNRGHVSSSSIYRLKKNYMNSLTAEIRKDRETLAKLSVVKEPQSQSISIDSEDRSIEETIPLPPDTNPSFSDNHPPIIEDKSLKKLIPVAIEGKEGSLLSHNISSSYLDTTIMYTEDINLILEKPRKDHRLNTQNELVYGPDGRPILTVSIPLFPDILIKDDKLILSSFASESPKSTATIKLTELPLPPILDFDDDESDEDRKTREKADIEAKKLLSSSLKLKRQNIRILEKSTQQKEWGNKCIDMYDIMAQIGEGTYGQVYKAKDTINGTIMEILNTFLII